VNCPGSGPGFVRRATSLAAAAVVAAGAGGLGAALFGGTTVSASGRGAVRAMASSATTTTTTNPWVPGTGGTITVGIDQAPTGCNPDAVTGDTWADRLLLEPVLPSAFTVNSDGQAVYNSAFITQAELQSTSPETVVYTINPSAVWSDGTPVTATDFVYTWQQERGTGGPVGSAPTTAGATTTTTTAASTASSSATAPPAATPPAATPPAVTPPAVTPLAVTTLPGATATTGPTVGYRQIASVTPGANGRSVTVVFKTPYADWQSLFNDVLPAHVLETTGWNPPCTTLDPAIDLSAGPYVLDKVVPGEEVVLARNPKWWEQTPPLQEIIVRIASGPAQLSEWLANGTVDVALPSGYNEHFLEAVTSQPSVVSQSQLSTTFLQLEFSTTSPLSSSTDLRLAIAHAIDRQSLVNEVVGWADSTIVPGESHLYAQNQPGYPGRKPPPLQVSGQPSTTSTTVAATPSTATLFSAGADLAASTRLFAAAGVFRIGTGPRELLTGKPYTLRMAVDIADPWASQAASALVSQLSAAGITTRVVDASGAQAAGMDLAVGNADMALIPLHSSPYSSQALAWYTPLLGAPGTGGSQDWSDFDDPTVSALLEKASQELNPVDAGPIYSEVDTELWQQMVALPLFTQPSLLAWSGKTAGVSPNTNGPSLLWDTQNWAIRVPAASPEAQS
jgi:peptide/nickel transport system substrate-binding protein